MPVHQVGEAAVVAALVVVAGDEVPLLAAVPGEASAPGEAAVVAALVVLAGEEVALEAAAPGALPVNAPSHAWLPSSCNGAQLSFLIVRLAYLSLALIF